uniref:Major facilitator superfamily (MFS) profile domain-containing protein n=1 Tax=Timema douglasi TaxID=61478 RepID=A0A7R8VGU8_TIMDO|nr:unnamed protein product [Timema douglasi]
MTVYLRLSYGFNGRLAFAIAASALGSSFQHGYNTGVVNAPQKVRVNACPASERERLRLQGMVTTILPLVPQLIEGWIREVEANRSDISPAEVEQGKVTMIWSIAVAIFCVGGMIGGAVTGLVAERFGRKGGLLFNNVLVIASAILQGCSQAAGSFEMIIIGRFLIGINSGLNAGLAPMYLAEISPVHLRGAVGTVYQLVITISILVSQILGLESVLGTEALWPVLLALTVVPGIFQLATLPLCPESPKYLLLSKGQEIEAQR